MIGEDGIPVPADDVYQIEKYREIYTKEQLTGYVGDNGAVYEEGKGATALKIAYELVHQLNEFLAEKQG